MPNSVHVAKLVGPALIGITVTEWLNLDIFTAAMGPTFATHVYLNGTLLFIAGLAIVRSHNVWTRDWRVLITLVGWIGVIGGLGRMVAPVSAQQAGRSGPVVYGSIAALFVVGLVLTFKAFGRRAGEASRPGGEE